jgi:hypothetical protein
MHPSDSPLIIRAEGCRNPNRVQVLRPHLRLPVRLGRHQPVAQKLFHQSAQLQSFLEQPNFDGSAHVFTNVNSHLGVIGTAVFGSGAPCAALIRTWAEREVRCWITHNLLIGDSWTITAKDFWLCKTQISLSPLRSDRGSTPWVFEPRHRRPKRILGRLRDQDKTGAGNKSFAFNNRCAWLSDENPLLVLKAFRAADH